MNYATGIVCGLTLAGTATYAAMQSGSNPAGTMAPPEIEVGKTVGVDWKGTGLMNGEVTQVHGNWVKLRFTVTDKTSKADGQDTSLSAVMDAWVNFDRLTYFVAPRPKK